jgi:mono/diheme cytochrome c family protein
MKQVYGVILGAAALAIALYFLWPRLIAPPPPEDPGSASLNTASLVAVSPPSKYEWVDRSQGVARIPIDRAIDILAEKGLPWGTVAPDPEPEPAKVEVATTGESKPAKPVLDPALVQIGQALFTMYRCAGCHAPGSAFPQLTGKYGTRVNLEGGETALFDEDYVRESILVPNAKISAGYKPVMPAYKDRIMDDEVNQIILYIRSLK